MERVALARRGITCSGRGKPFGHGCAPPYDDALSLGSAYLTTIDLLGGNNGVNITGVGTTFVATPAGIPIVGDLVNIVTQIGNGASTAAASIARSIGHFIGVGAGAGEVHADENDVGDEETFSLVALSGGNVAILSGGGYFCADHDREGRVWADRQGLGPWETWGFHRNGDGTVSFSSDQGWYMVAHPDRNNEIWTDRQAVQGDWEKFELHSQSGGQIALKSRGTGQYVSVAK
jgi:hypothetical protein